MIVLDIERLPAEATVAAWQCDAIWTAPTLDGAVLRAKLCLRDGYDAGEVALALALWRGIQ